MNIFFVVLTFLMSISHALGEPYSLVESSPKVLAKWESEGVELERFLKGKDGELFVKSLNQDLDLERDRVLKDPQRHKGYLHFFPIRWLTSKGFKFLLSGIVFRPDLKIENEGICGETRFLFRLAEKAPTSSNFADAQYLPMTLNVVFEHREQDSQGFCRNIWQAMDFRNKAASTVFLNKLVKGSLPQRLETNLQMLRFTSPQGSDVIEQGHYLLKVYRWKGSPRLLEISTLQNTVSPSLSEKSKDDLVDWVLKNQRDIRNGSFLIPQRFLAENSVSISPFGELRLPPSISQEKIEARSKKTNVKLEFDSEYLVRRLNSLSCSGCHSSRSIAGFHFLGEGRNNLLFNNLMSPLSPHAESIQLWREAQRLRLLSNNEPYAVPESERPSGGSLGAVCSPRASGDFASWKCNKGFRCKNITPTSDAGFGQCLPASAEGLAGMPCDVGTLSLGFTRIGDTYKSSGKLVCLGEGAVCATTNNGFPGGYCSRACTSPATTNFVEGKNEVCSAVPSLNDFSKCVDKKDSSFQECIASKTVMAVMPSCTFATDCLRDYACVKSNLTSAFGICAPPYFMEQLSIESRIAR